MTRIFLLCLGISSIVFMGCHDVAGPRSHDPSDPVPPSYFLGSGAAISLEKSTQGHDADTPPGPTLTPGEAVLWTYVVENTGSEALTGVYVLDDMEGFVCTVGFLGVGEKAECQLEGTAGETPYANEGTAVGYGMVFSAEVRANDWSHYGTVAARLESVGIDLKPGSDSNCLNPSSKGRTPVAILASSAFDPLQTDRSSILAGELVPPVRWNRGEDVNGDGLFDLVLHFKTQDLHAAGLLIDDGELWISGEMMGGGGFQGSDLVHLAGGPFCR